MSITPTITQGQQIVWTCDVCHEPVHDGTGYIECDRYAAQEQRRHVERNEAPRAPRRESGASAIPASDIEPLALVPWHAYHHGCDPHPESDTCWYDIERVNTLTKMLHRTGHLMEKRWFAYTDWRLITQSLDR